MVTQKARELRLALTQTNYDTDPREYGRLGIELHRELIENCIPTREEFATLYHGVIATPGALWDLALAVPKWERGYHA